MEVITIIACAVSVIVAFVSACGWFLNRMDARFVAADARMDARFTAVDARFTAADARMDARFVGVDARMDRLEERMGGVEHELSEVKVAIARLEGPLPRLVTSR